MEKIANAKKKKVDFPKGSKEKILEDNIISAMDEGFSNLSGAMDEGFSNLSGAMKEGFSNLSGIMKQGFSDLLNAINNLNSSKTNFVKDKIEKPNVTYSFGKSLTESSKKNSNSNKTANIHLNYSKNETNSSGSFPRKSNIIKKKKFKQIPNEGKEKKVSQLKTFQSLLPPKKKNTKRVFTPKADRINKKNEK